MGGTTDGVDNINNMDDTVGNSELGNTKGLGTKYVDELRRSSRLDMDQTIKLTTYSLRKLQKNTEV